MESLDLQDVVSLEKLAELTGFPVNYIKRELFLDGEDLQKVSLEELRKRVFLYLDSTF